MVSSTSIDSRFTTGPGSITTLSIEKSSLPTHNVAVVRKLTEGTFQLGAVFIAFTSLISACVARCLSFALLSLYSNSSLTLICLLTAGAISINVPHFRLGTGKYHSSATLLNFRCPTIILICLGGLGGPCLASCTTGSLTMCVVLLLVSSSAESLITCGGGGVSTPIGSAVGCARSLC